MENSNFIDLCHVFMTNLYVCVCMRACLCVCVCVCSDITCILQVKRRIKIVSFLVKVHKKRGRLFSQAGEIMATVRNLLCIIVGSFKTAILNIFSSQVTFVYSVHYTDSLIGWPYFKVLVANLKKTFSVSSLLSRT